MSNLKLAKKCGAILAIQHGTDIGCIAPGAVIIMPDQLNTFAAEIRKDERRKVPDMITLMQEAQEIVERKVLWKRFIDGTPLANDIAVWMDDFVRFEFAHMAETGKEGGK